MSWREKVRFKLGRTETRRRLVEKIGHTRDPRAVGFLVRAILDRDYRVRELAEDGLHLLDRYWAQCDEARRIVPRCLAMLKGDGPRRSGAAHLLGQIGEPGAVEPLLRALRHEAEKPAGLSYPGVFARPLGLLRDPRAAPPLVALLLHELAEHAKDKIESRALTQLMHDLADEADRSLGWHATPGEGGGVAEALGDLGDPCGIPALVMALAMWGADNEARERSLRNILEGIAARWNERPEARDAVPVLLALVTPRDKDDPATGIRTSLYFYVAADRARRKEALKLLSEIGAPGAADTIAPGLGSDDFFERKWAALALGATREGRAVGPLVAALRDDKDDVREAAARALAMIGSAQALPALLSAVRDTKGLVGHYAACSIGQIGGSEALDALVGLLGDSSPDVRRRAVRGLREAEDRRTVPALINALDDPDVRCSAAQALGHIGDPVAADALLQYLGDRTCHIWHSAALALGWLREGRAIDSLVDALSDGQSDLRRTACNALGELGDERAVQVLARALSDPDEWVRGEAATALGKIGHEAATEALIAALDDPSRHVRPKAAGALCEIGDPIALDAIVRTLESLFIRRPALAVGRIEVETDTCVNAAEALGRLGQARAVPVLTLALQDCDGRVRRAAREALAAITEPDAP